MKTKVLFVSIFCLLFAFINSLKAQKTEWLIESSRVTFKIKNAGFNVDGKFGAVSGNIIFDNNKNDNNYIDVSIDAKSINTGNGTRDGHLKKKDYFNVETYPKISMKASSFTKEKDGTITGNFKLTIKDKTKEILVPFVFIENNGKGKFSGNFTINRLDFGVGSNSFVLSDNATIEVEVSVTKKQ
jgi:polyisoprenoid-binding protein YceI